MLYLGTSPHEPAIRDLLDRRKLGLMCQPNSHHGQAKSGWLWAADNACFSTAWTHELWESRWSAFLEQDHPRAGCLFATVPDVVGDAAATLDRFEKYVGQVVSARFPVAFVAQDGQETLPVPWGEIDAIFIGGTTDWKESQSAIDLASQARERGKWVHVGRVNGWKRFELWAPHADSCDGSFLKFGPAKNVVRLMRWIDRYESQRQLPL